MRTGSKSQSISGTKLRVAIMSSQKKKLYLKSSTTIEFANISAVNKTKERISPAKKNGSAFFDEFQRRTSS
jgi:hypothetical protein